MVAEARTWSLEQGSLLGLSCGLTEMRTQLLGFLPWLTEGDGRRRARLRLRWEGEDGRLLWFGSSLAPIWSSNDRFIRNMEFILLKKMDAKGRFNFRRGGSILQRRGIFAAEGHFRCGGPFSQPISQPILQLRNEGGVLRNGTRVPRGVSHLRNGFWLRKLEISRFGDFATISQLRNEGRRLRNGTRVPRGGFATTKIFVEGGMGLRNDFETKWHFRSGFLGLRNNFDAKW